MFFVAAQFPSCALLSHLKKDSSCVLSQTGLVPPLELVATFSDASSYILFTCTELNPGFRGFQLRWMPLRWEGEHCCPTGPQWITDSTHVPPPHGDCLFGKEL